MTHAVVRALTIAPAFLLAPIGAAHPVETPADIPAEIKPLSAADIEFMKEQMPDFNKLMTGLQSVMRDPKVRSGLEEAAKAAGKAMDDVDMSAKTESGAPDMNAMMGAVLSLLGDEDLMTGLSDALSAAAIPMEEVMQEAVPPAAKPK